MWLEVLRFYRECLARAFSGKFWLIEKWTGGLGLLAVLATKFMPLPKAWQGMIENDFPLYFFITVFLIIVFIGFVIAPYEIYKEQREQRFQLEQARKPKLKVYVKSESGSREYSGSTLETEGGNRYTTLHSETSNGLSLVVVNIGETRISRCVATLLWVECVEGEPTGPLDIFEPILLPWSPTNTESNLSAIIEPGASCRVWIADVNYMGFAWIMRKLEQLPADYQQIFGPSGRYRALIQVSDGKSLSVQTKIEITSAEGEPTSQHPRGTGKASISILEQDTKSLIPPAKDATSTRVQL